MGIQLRVCCKNEYWSCDGRGEFFRTPSCYGDSLCVFVAKTSIGRVKGATFFSGRHHSMGIRSRFCCANNPGVGKEKVSFPKSTTAWGKLFILFPILCQKVVRGPIFGTQIGRYEGGIGSGMLLIFLDFPESGPRSDFGHPNRGF